MSVSICCPVRVRHDCRSEAQELGAAKQHLEQQLGYRVVAMLGHSKGGTDVLLYAGCYADQVSEAAAAAGCYSRVVGMRFVRRLCGLPK
jgi:S-formylglutathione hydrolase FrmB